MNNSPSSGTTRLSFAQRKVLEGIQVHGFSRDVLRVTVLALELRGFLAPGWEFSKSCLYGDLTEAGKARLALKRGRKPGAGSKVQGPSPQMSLF